MQRKKNTNSIAVVDRVKGARVRDALGTTRHPPLAADKVAARLPLNAVAAAVAVLVLHRGGSVGPPRVVVAVVPAGRGRRRLSPHELLERESRHVAIGSGDGECRARKGDDGRDDGGEGDHCAFFLFC